MCVNVKPKKLNSAKELLLEIPAGSRIFVHGAAASPVAVLSLLPELRRELSGCEFMHLHTHGPAEYADCPEFRVTNFFVGENMRRRIDNKRVDYLPCFLSEIPDLFRKGHRRPDVALVQVSPPDASGYCSLGSSVDVTRAAVDCARIVLAQVNPKVPRTHGDGLIPFAKITAYWEHEAELVVPPHRAPGANDLAIAAHVASLIEDGATLQIGVGAMPDAVLAKLRNHKHLGVHTETFSDKLLALIECGAIDNSRKAFHRYKSVTSFVSGAPELFRFVHDNPSVIFLESDYVNNANVIARNPKVASVNSAVEVDLTGQVVADSIGHRVISGVGGQMDFVRGATLSEGGKSIICLPSRCSAGMPRIVPELKPGAGVVTTRAHVQYIVTEFGVAELLGKTLGERARALIGIAHPDDRENLERKWFDQ